MVPTLLASVHDVHDDDQVQIALAEIELCGELMIAASATAEERLSPARIDEVLDVARAVRAALPAAG